MFTETPEAQAIIAWHDSQTEEFLASLPGYEDGLTPRQAWEAFCSLPATKQPGEGLAAPADAGQGAGTLPIEIPRSDTLWRLLTNGYSYSEISSWPDGHRDKTALLLLAGARWLQIRGEAAA